MRPVPQARHALAGMIFVVIAGLVAVLAAQDPNLSEVQVNIACAALKAHDPGLFAGDGVFGGSGGAGGTISTSGDNADGRVIISGNGNSGTRDDPGMFYSASYTDWAPEGGTCAFISAMGGAGGSGAYDSGSPGVTGDVIISY